MAANRIGYTKKNLGQLKILKDVIAFSVFVPFAVLYVKLPQWLVGRGVYLLDSLASRRTQARTLTHGCG